MAKRHVADILRRGISPSCFVPLALIHALIFFCSGIYRVPIKVVAEALFDALVEFDVQKPRHSSLREIHVVDVNVNNMHTLKAILFCKFRQFEQLP